MNEAQMHQEAIDAANDLTRVPDFAAVRGYIERSMNPATAGPVLKWLDKLEAWCADSVTAGKQDRDRIEALESDVEEAQRAGRDDAASARLCRDWIRGAHDVERELFTADQLLEAIRRERPL